MTPILNSGRIIYILLISIIIRQDEFFLQIDFYDEFVNV